MNLGWEKHKYDEQVKKNAISFTGKIQQPDLTKQALYETNPLSDKEHNDLASSLANINRAGLL
jgi:hypothetical protein